MNAVLLFVFVTGLAIFAIVGVDGATAQDTAPEEPSSIELILWESVRDGGDSERVRRFLKAFPSSRFAEEARALLESTDAHADDSGEKGTREASDQGTSGEERPADDQVLFERPLAIAIGSDSRRSLQQLVRGSPLFAPVEGLDEAHWAQRCSECHDWSRENLCAQGEFYLARDESALTRLRHPYGGPFKRAVKRWAEGGCR